jgi:hypothetical protein
MERFTDRQRRLHHYRQVARTLPSFATQKELYAVLPPLLPPKPLPTMLSMLGVGHLKSEVYLVDEDYEVRVGYVGFPSPWRINGKVEVGPRRDWLKTVTLPSKTPFDVF